MIKKILALILCISLLITACTKKNDVEINQPVEVEQEYDENKYELTAIKSDKQGIDNSSGFQLVSKDNINVNYVRENLQIIPEEDFKVEEISNTVVNIIPLNSLANDKIYQFKLNDEQYEYSWAFQTKKEFKVESTIPANDSNYVPVNTGIEMYFSLADFEDINKYFEIKPEAKGRFIINDNSVIFAPEKLANNTKYTVTIKKGFGLNDGSEKLKEDYVFTFTTESNQNTKIYFDNPLINITESNAKVVGAYINSQYRDKEFVINIYEYKGEDKFAYDVKQYAETGKYPENIKEDSNLVNICKINQKPYVDEEYSYRPKAIFELPDELKKGYYILEFNVEDISSYLFMQINDMLIYNTFFEEQIFVFAGDSMNSKGIKNAVVFLNDEKIGATDENGMLTVNKKAKDYKTVFMRIEADGYNDFIYADSNVFQYYYHRNLSEEGKYFRYLDTDRPVYLPTDTINIWGFARYRYEGSVNSVRIDLVETLTGLVIDSKDVKLTEVGTYAAQFELKNVTSGGLRIEVYDNDILIHTKYVEVRKYIKPLYTISGDLSKKIVYSGDDLNYKINANFFDGNPVPNLSVRLNTYGYRDYGFVEYQSMNEEIKLNENGEKIANINTVVKSRSWRPVYIEISSYNDEAEDMPVNIRDNFRVFPKKKMLEIINNTDNPTSVDILLHELVINDYNAEYINDFSLLRGNPLDDVINVKIIEIHYEKIKVGEYYDFINKTNQVIYDYNKIENIVYQENINTTKGIANIEIPNFDENRSYRVIASYFDEINETIEEETNIYGRFRPYGLARYSIEKDNTKDSYRLNESVNMELIYDNAKVEERENDNLVLLFARYGLVDCMNYYTSNIQFPFMEAYIPGASISGVYINNGYMYPVDNHILYDKTERQMYFNVSTNKEEYKPGEEVTLNINTFDENNNPCIADVNISVVDEAYFAVFEKDVNTLGDLYRYSWFGGIIKSYLSNIDVNTPGPAMAEMGGGGGSDNMFRDDFEDTAAFKTITTDKDGKATMKFKLPDNLTSWRITYQGVSDNLYAGSGTKNITVSLPFFVDLIMGKEYLKDDNINVSLRTFGTAATIGDEVDYKVTVVSKENDKKTDINTKGIIGDYTNVMIGKLNEGNYEIYITASNKNNKDAIKEEFSVVESYVYFKNTNYYKLTDKTVLDDVYSNPVITLYNESRSDFYNSLSSISSAGGRRIDQTVLSMIAKKYINDYFNSNIEFSEEELLSKISEYEVINRGYKLLPYSEEDFEVTAKLANLVDNEYLDNKFKVNFTNYLKTTKEYNTDVAVSLWGLSKYKEPVLLKIYDLLENNESLENRDKMYLSLALAELGDKKTANKYYKEFIEGAIQSGDYLYYDNKQNDTDNYELTALLSVLGVKLNNFETSDKLFKYIYNKPSKMTLSNFEQLMYIINRDIMKLDEIKDLFGEVTVTIDGEKKNYKLKLFDRESFAITKDKIKKIKFSNIKGSIACKVEALGNKGDLDKNKTDEMSMIINYTLKDTSAVQNKYNQSDIVAVTIVPSFDSKIEYGNYEITYIIPTGFRYIKAERDNYWANIDGQKLTFNYHYDRRFPIRQIVFYMQAAQKGEYTIDYAVIKEDMEPKLNYVNKTKLIIN